MTRVLYIVSALMLALSLTGLVSAQENVAQVRFVHAAVDVGPVDIFVDANRVASGVNFADVSAYVAVSAGVHKLTFMIPGQDAAEVASTTATFDGGRAYTVAAGKQSEMRFNVLNDDLSVPPAGKARVRLSHLSPDAPPVDAEIVNGPTLFENIGFGKSSAYELVDAGTYSLRVVAAGESTVFLQLPNTQLQAGKTYDIFAVGRQATLWAQIAEVTPSQGGTPVAITTTTMPQNMPNTAGDEPQADLARWLLVLAPIFAAAGFALRRTASSRPTR